MTLAKILIMLGALLALSIPFLPVRFPLCLRFYNRNSKQRPSNLTNVIAVVITALAVIILLPYVLNLVNWLLARPLIARILARFQGYVSYDLTLVRAIIANVAYCLAVILILAILAIGSGLQKSARGAFRWLRDKIKQGIASIKEKRKKAREKSGSEPEKKEQKEETNQLPANLLPDPEEEEPGHLITIAERNAAATERRMRKGSRASGGKQEDDRQEEDKKQLSVAALFLEQEGEDWYPKQQSHHGAKHLKYFLIACGVIYLIVFMLLMIPALFPLNSAGWFYRLMTGLADICYLYPAVAMVILTEIFWYLNGETRLILRDPDEDPDQRFTGRVVDLDMLEKDLLDQYGSSYNVKSFYSSDVEGLHMPTHRVDLDSSQLLSNIAVFVQQEGFEVNSEYLQGIEALMNGKNVLFHAPLYTALGMYLYAYLSTLMMQGEQIVVICQNEQEVPNVIENLETGLLRVAQTHKLIWKISDLENLSTDLDEDILVVTPEELCDERSYLECREFLRHTSLVLLTDANKVVSANNYLCQIISQRIKECRGDEIQYLFLSTLHTANLENALVEYFLLKDAPEAIRGDYAYGDIHIFVWRSSKKNAVELDNAAQTVTLEVGISTIAANHGIPNLNVISKQAIFSGQINDQWLSVFDASEQPIGFLVTADEDYNLPGTIYSYARYIGKKASVLHVVSKPYLLRDYFYAHAPRYLYEQPLMGRTIAEHAQRDKTQLILLMCSLMRGMPVRQFTARLSEIEKKEMKSQEELGIDEIRAQAERFLEMVLGHPLSKTEEHFSLYVPEDVFYAEEYIRIREDDDVLRPLLEETGLVKMYLTGERQPVYLPLFKKMLCQQYLEGQNMVYDNRNYTIYRIDQERGEIYVDDTNAVHGISEAYIQVRKYSLENGNAFIEDCRTVADGGNTTNPGVTGTRVEFTGAESAVRSMSLVRSKNGFEMTADTTAYYMLQNSTLRVDDETLLVTKLLPDMQERIRRHITSGVYLHIELGRAQNDYLTMTVAVLLQEVMKTMFPDQYHCLSVCAILQEPDLIFGTGEDQVDKIAGMYPRLYGWDRVAENAIELLIVDDCEGGTGTMGLLCEQQGLFLRNIFWMLSDYLEWQAKGEENHYLYFGMDSEPVIFDLESAGEIMKVFAQQYVRQHDRMAQLEQRNTCGFCLDYLERSFPWKGRRNICEHCDGEYRPKAEESQLIMDFICQWIQEAFQVEIEPLGVETLPVEEFEGSSVSMLNMEGRKVSLAEDLPLTVVHEELVQQIVRYWQLTELSVDGDPLLDGQVPYVLLQYLQRIEQHQRRRRRYRRLLVSQEDDAQGFFLLEQELQQAGHNNSFAFLLNYTPKTEKPSIRKFNKRSSKRKSGETPKYYHYEHLSEGEKKAYDLILAGLMEMAKQIDISEASLLQGRLDSLIRAIHNDHPEIFWWNSRYQYTYSDIKILEVLPYYTLTREERQQRQEELDEATEKFMAEVPADLGDYETALKLYEVMISMLDYDSIALDRQKRSGGVKAEIPDDLRSVYGALVQKKAVCAGYAVGYQYLLQKAGIESMYVRGQIKSDNEWHAWNIINMEGNYYHVDVTWADGSNTLMSKNSETSSYAFFGLTDAEIHKSRTIDQELPVPRCTEVDCNYFVREGLYLTSYDYAEVKRIIKERIADGTAERVDLRFTSLKLLQAASNHLMSNGGIFEILRELEITDRKPYSVPDYDFNILSIFMKKS